jgi:superfamily II DNA or RNA helicase
MEPGGIAIPRNAAIVPRSVILGATDCTTAGDYRLFKAPSITLRPHQEPVLATVMDALSGSYPYGGIILAKPGSGKTVMALEVARRLCRTTLILVHTTALMTQWGDRIREHLPGARVGFVRQGMCQFGDNYDFVVGMLESLSVRQYPSAFYRWPGVVITDEVHRLGAETWAPVIVQFPAKVRLGLTATPRRKDGLEPVFFWHVGPIISTAKHDAIMTPTVKVVKYIKTYKRNFIQRNGNFNRARWLTSIGEDAERNWVLCQFILKALRNGRKILCLSDRLEQIAAVRTMLAPHVPTGKWVSPYVGECTPAERMEAVASDVIMATYPIAAEGLDIPDLDTLIFMTPRGDVEQAVGRIQRVVPGKLTPVVIDIVDAAYRFGVALAKVRRRVYERIGAMMHEGR